MVRLPKEGADRRQKPSWDDDEGVLELIFSLMLTLAQKPKWLHLHGKYRFQVLEKFPRCSGNVSGRAFPLSTVFNQVSAVPDGNRARHRKAHGVPITYAIRLCKHRHSTH